MYPFLKFVALSFALICLTNLIPGFTPGAAAKSEASGKWSCERFFEFFRKGPVTDNFIDKHPDLTKALERALKDPEWFADYIKHQPGQWIEADGLWTRYVVYPGRNAIKKRAPAPFRLGSGLSVALERTIQAEDFLKALTKDRDVYAAESPGAGLSAVRNIIERKFSPEQEIPEEISMEVMNKFMVNGWGKIVEDAAKRFPKQLTPFTGKFTDVDHSWAGWVKMALLPNPEVVSQIKSVTFLTPGAQTTDEHLMPIIRMMREEREFSAEMMQNMPVMFNPFPLLEVMSTASYRQNSETMFKTLKSLKDDTVARKLALARLMGIRKIVGFERLAKLSPEMQVNVVVAQGDSIVSPDLLANVLDGARARGERLGKLTTSGVIIPGEHEVMETNSPFIYEVLAQVSRNDGPVAGIAQPPGKIAAIFNKVISKPLKSMVPGGAPDGQLPVVEPGKFYFLNPSGATPEEKLKEVPYEEFDAYLRGELMDKWKARQNEILQEMFQDMMKPKFPSAVE